jgi:hypothetical protein
MIPADRAGLLLLLRKNFVDTSARRKNMSDAIRGSEMIPNGHRWLAAVPKKELL